MRRIGRPQWPALCAAGLALVAGLFGAVMPVLAEREPIVTASFEGAPESVNVGATVDLVLRLRASADAVDVTAEILPAPMIQVVGGLGRWSGSLARGSVLDIPVSVQFTGAGEYTLGARVTNRLPSGREQVSGAVLYVSVTGDTATLNRTSHGATRLRAARTAGDLQSWGVAEPASAHEETGAAPAPRAASGTVSGTVQWKDFQGNTHPIRRALVEFYDGNGVYLGAFTGTNDAGFYSAAVTTPTDSVRVTVFTQDIDNLRVILYPPDQPTSRYILSSPVTPLGGPATTINFMSATPVAGTPGSPSPDTTPDRVARALSVFDSMLTFWFQATALIGHNMQQAKTLYPRTDSSVSAYSSATEEMKITRHRALAWDVLGHEFFHFVTHKAPPLRQIVNSPGGSHSGGSAIGELPCPTCPPRNRDEGMRLAWSEGTATYFSLALQNQPADSSFPFPANLALINDGKYTTTEENIFEDLAEAPEPNEGFGSENSIFAMLWDLLDTNQDGGEVIDSIAGVSPQLVWSAINALLPCNPCDRVDRVWTGVRNFFGADSPVIFDYTKPFVINNMAPRATAPPNGGKVAGGVGPKFEWVANGDPSADHRNKQFRIVISRDDFHLHKFMFDVPLNETSFTPTDAGWLAVLAGGTPDTVYKWYVEGTSTGDPEVPAGSVWISNLMTLTARTIHGRITWTPLGADVDFHLAPPAGQDVAYYNRDPGWATLDRDCITSCTEENISFDHPIGPGNYRLFTHYFSDHNKGAATVHAEVFFNDTKVIDETFVLGKTGDTHNILTENIPGSSAEPARVMSGPASRRPLLDSRTLPPK